MTWIQTHLGGSMDLLSPRPEDVHPHDIAVSLARLPRFNGHTLDLWSVAQHSTLVLRIAEWMVPHPPAGLRLAALLHDAHEAYIGDISTPVGELLGSPLRRLKGRLDTAIRARFGLPETLPEGWDAIIEQCDGLALASEKNALLAPCQRDWDWDLPEPWLFADLSSVQGRYEYARQFKPTLENLIEEVKGA
jgi:hypothetical protein